ncbi:hypothetical protein BD324DRAFT_637857 [Kockovaella imperatae]|uniref:Protein kinase domain-containing protein n=1 Tax=Kockovaella imperatae TaxID=4999 RepID=A0A1Y1U8V2_9TREE|nr:hypothetical protein BD324DRAFT_637857 [Kockovaella imperatae]ORX33974.1 hypothetical protein BD324DRAFT_637857 [Kockovaella imperatae]
MTGTSPGLPGPSRDPSASSIRRPLGARRRGMAPGLFIANPDNSDEEYSPTSPISPLATSSSSSGQHATVPAPQSAPLASPLLPPLPPPQPERHLRRAQTTPIPEPPRHEQRPSLGSSSPSRALPPLPSPPISSPDPARVTSPSDMVSPSSSRARSGSLLGKIRVQATVDNESFTTVDITGMQSAEGIKDKIFSKLRFRDDEYPHLSLFTTDVDLQPSSTRLTNEALLHLCLTKGDAKANLKFFVMQDHFGDSSATVVPPAAPETELPRSKGFRQLASISPSSSSLPTPDEAASPDMDDETRKLIAQLQREEEDQTDARRRQLEADEELARREQRAERDVWEAMQEMELENARQRTAQIEEDERRARQVEAEDRRQEQERQMEIERAQEEAARTAWNMEQQEAQQQRTDRHTQFAEDRRQRAQHFRQQGADFTFPTAVPFRPGSHPHGSTRTPAGYIAARNDAPSTGERNMDPRLRQMSGYSYRQRPFPALNTDPAPAVSRPPYEGVPQRTYTPVPSTSKRSYDTDMYRSSSIGQDGRYPSPVSFPRPHTRNGSSSSLSYLEDVWDDSTRSRRGSASEAYTTLAAAPRRASHAGDDRSGRWDDTVSSQNTVTRQDVDQWTHIQHMLADTNGLRPTVDDEDDDNDDNDDEEQEEQEEATLFLPASRPNLSVQTNARRGPFKNTDQHAGWHDRPNPEALYEVLDEAFPEVDLDKPFVDPGLVTPTTPGAESPSLEQQHQPPLLAPIRPPVQPTRDVVKTAHRKSIRVLAARTLFKDVKNALTGEHKEQEEKKPEDKPKRRASMWGHKIQEVTPSRLEDVPPTIPESPAADGKPATLRWVKGELIGSGSYGKVFLALNVTTGDMMAVKQVERQSIGGAVDKRLQGQFDSLKSEIALLKDLFHPNIVAYLGWEETPEALSIFLEYIPGGTIAAIYRTPALAGGFEEQLVKYFTRQILEGLLYLHERNILHRDLKGDNILVDLNGQCKIVDFGISKRYSDVYDSIIEQKTMMKGSWYWMAPEVLGPTKGETPKSYSGKIDIWSTGCCVVEMFTGQKPFPGVQPTTAILMVFQGDIPPIPTDIGISSTAMDFMTQRCLVHSSENRATAAECLRHPFITEVDSKWTFAQSKIGKFLAKKETKSVRRGGRGEVEQRS